jgi:hypothetical protein
MGMRGWLCAALAATLLAAPGCSGGSGSNDASGAAGSNGGGGTTGAAGTGGTTGTAGTTGAGGTAGAGGTTAAGGASGGGGATGGAGGGATNAACQAIRLCAIDCADAACIMNSCKPMGRTAAAETAFQALYDCTLDPARGNCPSLNDVNCMCMAQYLQDPPCADALFDCVGNIIDTIADRCF